MKSLTPLERESLLIDSLRSLLDGKISEGQVLRRLRKEALGLSQQEYAAFVGVSRRTLSDIENDVGSQSITVMNAVFKPLGLRIGLLPRSKTVFAQMAGTLSENETPVRALGIRGFKR